MGRNVITRICMNAPYIKRVNVKFYSSQPPNSAKISQAKACEIFALLSPVALREAIAVGMPIAEHPAQIPASNDLVFNS
jgi:hypothetical protein